MNIHLLSEDEFQAIMASLARIETTLADLKQKGTYVMAEIDDMITAINDVKGVEDSATELITQLLDKVNGLVQQATDLATLKNQVADATNQIRSNAQPLSDAVAANPAT